MNSLSLSALADRYRSGHSLKRDFPVLLLVGLVGACVIVVVTIGVGFHRMGNQTKKSVLKV